MAKRTLWRRVYYRFWWWVARYVLLVFYRVRVHDERYVPMTGGTMLLANHQSHLDPPSIGSVVRRRTNFLARKTLFKGLQSWHYDMLDAIPLDQEGIGLIHIQFGPPLMPEESAQLNDTQLMAEIDRRIRQCFEQARAKRRRAMGGLL